MAFRQDMRRQALATAHPRAHRGEAGRVTVLPDVVSAGSTGLARPEAPHQPCPGSAGRAANAGATLQAGWDSQSRGLGHVALPPWHSPDQRSVDTVVA